MKNFFKKIQIKPLLISVLIVIFQSVLFFLSKIIQASPSIIGNSLDDKIPFSNIWIIPYYAWYAMIFFIPYYYYLKDKKLLVKYTTAYVIAAIASSIIFIIFPSTVIRPTLENNNLFNILTNIVYFVDNPAINCFPSMHCAISMLFILSSYDSKNLSKRFRIIVSIISILIMISTLFTKQHVIVDLVSGVIMMSIIYLFIASDKKLNSFIKRLLKI